jgi:hypothetical protein
LKVKKETQSEPIYGCSNHAIAIHRCSDSLNKINELDAHPPQPSSTSISKIYLKKNKFKNSFGFSIILLMFFNND